MVFFLGKVSFILVFGVVIELFKEFFIYDVLIFIRFVFEF